MLILERHTHESFAIKPSCDIHNDMTVAELSANGPIEINIEFIRHAKVKVGVVVPRDLDVLSDE